MSEKPRSYAYDLLYQSSPEQKHRRAIRNRDRRRALRAGKVHKGDGKDVHHRDSKNMKRPTVISASKNRSIK